MDYLALDLFFMLQYCNAFYVECGAIVLSDGLVGAKYKPEHKEVG